MHFYRRGVLERASASSLKKGVVYEGVYSSYSSAQQPRSYLLAREELLEARQEARPERGADLVVREVAADVVQVPARGAARPHRREGRGYTNYIEYQPQLYALHRVSNALACTV